MHGTHASNVAMETEIRYVMLRALLHGWPLVATVQFGRVERKKAADCNTKEAPISLLGSNRNMRDQVHTPEEAA